MSPELRLQVVAALLEGHSIRAVSQGTGVPCNSIRRLLVAVGSACAEHQQKVFGTNWRRTTEDLVRSNGFSKNLSDYVAAVSLHFMAAGVTGHVCEVADIVKLLNNMPRPNYRDETHYGAALGHEPRGYRHRGACLSIAKIGYSRMRKIPIENYGFRWRLNCNRIGRWLSNQDEYAAGTQYVCRPCPSFRPCGTSKGRSPGCLGGYFGE